MVHTYTNTGMTTPYCWVSSLSSTPTTFTFTFFIGPPCKYTFDTKPTHPHPAPFKRRRPLWDVDGSSHPTKKKRRLRLDLVTSRLSQPYSAPASNIADRGVARVGGSWPLPRRAERNELRKAAIMNRVRQRLLVLKAAQTKQTKPPPPSLPVPPVQLQLPQPQPQKRTHSQLVSALALRDVVAPMARTHEIPSQLPPSPLGLSNYDALDLEDEEAPDDNMDGEDIDAEMSGCAMGYYSHFSVPRSPRTDADDYDYLDELDGIPPLSLEDEPPPLPQLPPMTPGGEMAVLMEQNEGQGMDAYMATAVQASGTYVMA